MAANDDNKPGTVEFCFNGIEMLHVVLKIEARELFFPASSITAPSSSLKPPRNVQLTDALSESHLCFA
jgi:hypothetical protein